MSFSRGWKLEVSWLATQCSWRWTHHSPPKHRYPTTKLHGITTQKISILIVKLLKNDNRRGRVDIRIVSQVTRLQILWPVFL